MRAYRSLAWLLLVFGMLSISVVARAQVVISVGFAPPALPVYEQPICPGDGYIWTPGYWAWDGEDYYWVPGTWVLAPEPGFFWTPPYWVWEGAAFIFHDGYWGPHVGFYGGINYGFGYFGEGFVGGRWDGGHFYYNRAVTNVNVTVIHNVYNTRVENVTVNHISYNGGQGGLTARPNAQQEQWEHERHVGPVAAQTQHVQEARGNQDLRASYNHGRPPIGATTKPAAFNEATKVTSAAHYNSPARVAGNPSRAAVHPNDLEPHKPPQATNTGSAQQNQQRQQQMYERQQQEHQQLQQKQEQEHQQAEKQKYNEAQKQQMEQRHQQQTQQMEQRHVQEQQHAQQPHQQAPPHENPHH